MVNEGFDGMRLVFLSLALLFLAAADVKAQLARDDAFHARYHLDKVVMVGRHHVRSGVISKTERRITPHQWHQWTVGDGNLTERGAMLEQQMGAFYRLWTMQEGLYGEAPAPVVSQTRLYANSMPRTVETARSFAAGFSPDHAMEADYDKSVKFGSMSPVFNDVSTKVTPKILAKANAEVEDGCAPDGFAAAVARLEEDAAVMARVLDLQNSPACQLHDTCSFLFTNPQIFLRQKIMPRITAGLIYLAQMASGNLILQYYDMPESRGSIFGHPVTLSDLCSIGRVKDSWCFLSMGFPTIGRDVAHNLLIRLKNEMEDPTVRLSYLVGHDSNMAALAGALELEKYVLENTPEEKTPLGGKMTFEVWKDADDNAFVALNYVYQISSTSISPPICWTSSMSSIISSATRGGPSSKRWPTITAMAASTWRMPQPSCSLSPAGSLPFRSDLLRKTAQPKGQHVFFVSRATSPSIGLLPSIGLFPLDRPHFPTTDLIFPFHPSFFL